MIIKRVLRYLKYLGACLVVLLLLILIAVNLPFVQRIITKKANVIFAEKNIPVNVGKISFQITGRLALSDVQMIRSNGDTIVYAKEISASVKMIPLIFHKIKIQSITIDNATVNIATDHSTGKLNIISIFPPGEKNINAEKSKGKNWEISVGSLYLSKVKFALDDSVNAIHIGESVDKLVVTFDRFSIPDRQIFASYISIINSDGGIWLGASSDSTTNTGSKGSWSFKLKDSGLKRVHFTFAQPDSKQKMEFSVSEGAINNAALDLGGNIISVGKVDLKRPFIKILSTSTMTDSSVKSADPGFAGLTGSWKISAKDISISDGSFSTGAYPEIRGGQKADSGFTLTELNGELSDLMLKSRLSHFKLEAFSFALPNGARLKKGDIIFSSDSASKTTLKTDITTPNSHFNLSLEAGSGLNEIIRSYWNVPFSLSISDTRISARDLLLFFPDLAKNKKLNEDQDLSLTIKCDISGNSDVLNIGTVELKSQNEASLTLSGKITGLNHPSDAKLSLKLNTSPITASNLREITALFNSGLKIPEFDPVSVSGSIDSTVNRPMVHLQLLSGSGNLKIDGSVDTGSKDYDLKVSASRIDLGRFTGIADLGSFTGSVGLKGNGFDPGTMKTDLLLTIDTAVFKGYSYSGISASIGGNEGLFSYTLRSADSAFRCDLNGSASFKKKFEGAKANGTFDIDAGKLHLYNDLMAKGNLESSFEISGDSINGSFSLKDLILTKNMRQEGLKDITVTFNSSDSMLMGRIRSDFLNADADYAGSAENLVKILKEGRLRGSGIVDSTVRNKMPYISKLPDFRVNIESVYNPVVGLFLNDTVFSYNKFYLKLIKDTIGIARAEMTSDRIRYKGSAGSGISMKFETNPGKSALTIKADSMRSGNLYLTNVGVDLTSSGDTAIYKLEASDKNKKLLYDIDGAAYRNNGEIRIKSRQPQWVINGTVWNVSRGDFLVLYPAKGDLRADLHWKNDSSSIDITGQKSERILLTFNKVGIRMLAGPGLNTYGFDGELTGKIGYHGNKDIQLDIQMLINQLKVSGNILGNMSVKGNYLSDTLGVIKSELNVIINDSSKLSLVVSYGKDEGQKNIRTEFTELPLKLLESVSGRVVNGIHGNISGGLTIAFPGNKPQINGTVKIRNTDVKIVPLNSRFYLTDDVIKLENNQLRFNNFTVLDSLRKKLNLSGTVDLNDINNITADLKVTSDHIQIMNTTEKDNKSFNGSIFVNTNLSISGPVKVPVISGSIILGAGTVVNYKYVEDLNISETEKIITFTGPGGQPASQKKKNAVDNPFSKAPDIKASIEIDPQSQFNFQISQGYDISVSINGTGFLNYAFLPNNTVSLNGTYEIRKGSSTFKITGWPRKDFDLTTGSYIKWTGAVDDPELHIETTSKVRGSYINPLDDKNREIDFLVYMKINSRLSDLSIVFDVGSNDQYITSVFNTLSADERMKQAINLLIFERIDLPNLSNSSDYVSQQINQFWESQINRFTKSAIKGLDLSFGLDTHTGGTKDGGSQTFTSLSYQVKKDMFRDRGSVLVSGRVNDANTVGSQSNTVIENFIFEYALDSSRTKFLKVYRKNDYEDLLEGEVIKSGVGFIYRKSYDKVRDIWRRQKKSGENRSAKESGK